MKAFRLFLYFLVGLLLGHLATLARAETIPASYGQATVDPIIASYTTGWGATNAKCEQACLSHGTGAVPSCTTPSAGAPGTKVDAGTCTHPSLGQTWIKGNSACPSGYVNFAGVCKSPSPGYYCPSTGGWTLNGTMCTRPDQDKCAPTKDKYNSGWVSYTGSRVPTGTVCIGSCNYEQNIMLDQDDRIGTDGRKWAQVGQTGLGTSCTGSTTPSMEPDQKNKESKKPPCGATEGVLTTSTGKVLCVPEGTPDARKPGVTKENKTETYPDGSQKKTETTTTRDPATNAKDTSVTTTTTAGPTGGTQAGPTGTTTSSSSTSSGSGGTGSGDGGGDGNCDPTLNFCGGPGTDGMYTKKEKTMSSVFTQFQNTVKNSPVGSASTDFFTVSTPGGSCPAWSVHVPMLDITLNAADYFCNGGILAALQGAGYVMLALATYIAFTWAFL